MTRNHIKDELRHILRELFATKQMEMDVLDRLTTVLADICNDSVSVFKSASRGNLGHCLKDRLNAARVICGDSVGRFNVAFWNDENVNGSLRSNILEGIYFFILVYLCGGDLSRDYFTE